MQSETQELRPGSIVGDYVVGIQLGRGAQGTVYAARHSEIALNAAIKVIDPVWAQNADWVRRFKREAEIVAKLAHPNIVRILNFTTQPQLAIVMEYVDGASLRFLPKPNSHDEVVRIVTQIASALAHVHDKGVIHRDLKPENVVVSKDGTVKVLDFGLAREISKEEGSIGLRLGTPEYMAPEQVLIGGRALPESDVFALGLIMYELVTGHPLFEGDPGSISLRKTAGELPDLSAFKATPALERLLLRMLAIRPSERPSPQAIIEALRAPERELLPSRLRPVLLATVGAASLAIFALHNFVTDARRKPTPPTETREPTTAAITHEPQRQEAQDTTGQLPNAKTTSQAISAETRLRTDTPKPIPKPAATPKPRSNARGTPSGSPKDTVLSAGDFPLLPDPVEPTRDGISTDPQEDPDAFPVLPDPK